MMLSFRQVDREESLVQIPAPRINALETHWKSSVTILMLLYVENGGINSDDV